MQTDNDDLVTVTEVAKLSKRSRASVHRDIRAGRLAVALQTPHLRGAFLITRGEAERYAKSLKEAS